MPIEFDNRPINVELLDATTIGKPEQVQAILDRGANPNATMKTTTGIRNVVINAISLGKSKALAVLLQHSEKPGQTILDLSQPNPCAAPENPDPPSIIITAFLKSNRKCWVLLHDYFVKHSNGKTYASVINKPFLVLHGDGKYHQETLGHAALKMFSIHAISENSAIFKSQKVDETVENSFAFWLAHNKDNHNPPDKIVYYGPQEVFEYAIPKELDILAANYKGQTVVSFASELEECTHDPELWKTKGKPRLQYVYIEQTGDAFSNGKDGIYMPVTLSNLFNTNPFSTVLVPSFSELTAYLNAAAAAQIAPPTPGVTALAQRVDAHGLRLDGHDVELVEVRAMLAALQKQLNALSEEFAKTAEAQFAQACKNLVKFPNILSAFKRLQTKLESLMRQKGDAALKVFTTNPSKQDRMALTFLQIFSYTLQCCPVTPFASIIPVFGEIIYRSGAALRDSRRHGAVFDVTVDIKPMAFGTCIASFLFAETMRTVGEFDISADHVVPLAEGLFDLVAPKVDKMYTQTFDGLEDVFCFSCEDAVATIHSHKKPGSPDLSESKHSEPAGRAIIPAKRLGDARAKERVASVTAITKPAAPVISKCYQIM